MNRAKIFLMILAVLLFGATLGGLGGYRYAEQQIGAEHLSMLHKAAESNVKSYRRIKQFVETDDRARLLNYLDSIIHTEMAVLESTQLPASDSQSQ